MQTSFSPHLSNKTTAVAMVDAPLIQPHYLIKTGINEVIRLLSRGIAFSTAVVLSKKLGRNEVYYNFFAIISKIYIIFVSLK